MEAGTARAERAASSNLAQAQRADAVDNLWATIAIAHVVLMVSSLFVGGLLLKRSLTIRTLSYEFSCRNFAHCAGKAQVAAFFAAAMKAVTLWWSFFPGAASTPVETSTPKGRT